MNFTLLYPKDNFGHNYSFNSVWFALARKPTKDGVVKLKSQIHSCRETLCMDMCRLMGGDLPQSMSKTSARLSKADTERLYLMGYTQAYSENDTGTPMRRKQLIENKRAAILKGVRLINSLERNAGWSLTRMHWLPKSTTGETYDRSILVFFVHGSPKWHRAPAYLSLYCALLRAGFFSPVKNREVTSAKKTFLDLQKLCRNGASRSGGGDIPYIKMGLKYGLPFLKKANILFKGRSVPYNYGAARLGNKTHVDISIEGFHRLFNGNTHDKELLELVQKHVIDVAE